MIPATFLGMGLAIGSLLPALVLVLGATFGAAIDGSTGADVRRIPRGSAWRSRRTARLVPGR